jgi:hypothetical protein
MGDDQGPVMSEWEDGTRVWTRNGTWHRTDGPAVEYHDGMRLWFIEGQGVSFTMWLDMVSGSEEERLMLQMRWG